MSIGVDALSEAPLAEATTPTIKSPPRKRVATAKADAAQLPDAR